MNGTFSDCSDCTEYDSINKYKGQFTGPKENSENQYSCYTAKVKLKEGSTQRQRLPEGVTGKRTKKVKRKKGAKDIHLPKMTHRASHDSAR